MAVLNKKTIEDVDVNGSAFLLAATLTFRSKTVSSPTKTVSMQHSRPFSI